MPSPDLRQRSVPACTPTCITGTYGHACAPQGVKPGHRQAPGTAPSLCNWRWVEDTYHLGSRLISRACTCMKKLAAREISHHKCVIYVKCGVFPTLAAALENCLSVGDPCSVTIDISLNATTGGYRCQLCESILRISAHLGRCCNPYLPRSVHSACACQASAGESCFAQGATHELCSLMGTDATVAGLWNCLVTHWLSCSVRMHLCHHHLPAGSTPETIFM